VAITQVVEH